MAAVYEIVKKLNLLITYDVHTWEGWLYLAIVLDTYSRRLVGWSMANNLKTGAGGS